MITPAPRNSGATSRLPQAGNEDGSRRSESPASSLTSSVSAGDPAGLPGPPDPKALSEAAAVAAPARAPPLVAAVLVPALAPAGGELAPAVRGMPRERTGQAIRPQVSTDDPAALACQDLASGGN